MSTQSSHHNTVEDLVTRFNEVRSLGNLPTPSVCCHSAEGGFCLRTTGLMLPCPVRGRSVSYFTPRGCCCSYITIWNCWCFWRKGTWWLLAVVAHSFVKCTVIQIGRLVWLCTPICVKRGHLYRIENWKKHISDFPSDDRPMVMLSKMFEICCTIWQDCEWLKSPQSAIFSLWGFVLSYLSWQSSI